MLAWFGLVVAVQLDSISYAVVVVVAATAAAAADVIVVDYIFTTAQPISFHWVSSSSPSSHIATIIILWANESTVAIVVGNEVSKLNSAINGKIYR